MYEERNRVFRTGTNGESLPFVVLPGARAPAGPRSSERTRTAATIREKAVPVVASRPSIPPRNPLRSSYTNPAAGRSDWRHLTNYPPVGDRPVYPSLAREPSFLEKDVIPFLTMLMGQAACLTGHSEVSSPRPAPSDIDQTLQSMSTSSTGFGTGG
ncbi:hypothetical protein GQ600_15664 [Phytophthora cactorum]|nr:hypothetical protein GQ600_15664 [Phytophthora cactorum]